MDSDASMRIESGSGYLKITNGPSSVTYPSASSSKEGLGMKSGTVADTTPH